MAKIIALLLFLVPVLALGKTANDVYKMPSSGNVPGWGKIDTANIVTDILLPGVPGVAPTGGGSYFLLGQAAESIPLIVLRGTIAANGGSILNGGGFAIASGGTGIYTATYNTAFGDVPSTTCTCDGNTGIYCTVFHGGGSPGAAFVILKTFNIANAAAACIVSMIAVGPRP